MLPMGLNINLPPMKMKYQVAVAALPIGLMFGAFIPLIFFAGWLESALAVPHNSPIKDSANGAWWLSLFLTAMVILMVSGYIAGWLLNALISRWALGWPAERVIAIYMRSEVPPEWLRAPDSVDLKQATGATSASKWELQRAGGAIRFIVRRGVLSWGVAMFVAMYLYPTLAHGRPLEMTSLLRNAAIWTVVGALFGWVFWILAEWSYRKSAPHRGSQ